MTPYKLPPHILTRALDTVEHDRSTVVASTSGSIPHSPSRGVSPFAGTMHSLQAQQLQHLQSNTVADPEKQSRLMLFVQQIGDKLISSSTIDALNGSPEFAFYIDPIRENHYFDFYTSPSFTLTESYAIDRLEARVSKPEQTIKLLTLASSERLPIDRKAVEKQFGSLECYLPRGESSEEMAFFVKKQPWGELRFGYDQHRPDLLKVIVFDMG